MRRGLLALVFLMHVGGGWALTWVEPVKLVVGDVTPMEVRMVAGEPAVSQGAPDLPLEEPPPLPDLKPPPPELAEVVEPPPPDLPPPEIRPPAPELATVVEPPPRDLPPPVFPVEAPPPKPAEKPPEPKHVEPPKPKPSPPRPAQNPAPSPAPKQTPSQQAAAAQAGPAAPAAPTAPKTISVAQIGYLVPPNPVYPQRSRRTGEQGRVVVRALVDVAGRPAQVALQSSSGHPALDDAALSAVRAAQFRPYAEGGVPQVAWVIIPINFELQ